MKILFIASDTNALGGIQQYNRKFLAHLKNRRDQVTLVELKNGAVFNWIFFVLRSLFFGAIKKPDVIVCAHVNYSPLGFFLKKFFGRKYIVCTHGIDVWDVKSVLQRRGLKNADLITTVAEFTRDKMISQMPELANRIYLLYNCTDGARFIPKQKSKELVARYGLENKKVIFTISRLSALEGYKGYDRVVRAMPEVLKEVPNAIYLLGGSGDDAPRVERLVEELGLQQSVIMPGRISEEELVDHYNLADVFIMPSKAEGAPAVFIEALACGVPVIAGNQDGSSTPLKGGELGLLINPEDVHEIALALVRTLTGKTKKELLDKNFLRTKVLERFGLEMLPKRIDEVLKRVV